MRHWALLNVGIRGLLLGSLLLAGCASSMVTMERHRERAVAPLQRQSDADSLAAAALFQVTKNRAQALDLYLASTRCGRANDNESRYPV